MPDSSLHAGVSRKREREEREIKERCTCDEKIRFYSGA